MSGKQRLLAALLLAAPLFAACEGDPHRPPVDGAVTLAAVDPAVRNGVAGQPLPDLVAVRLTSERGEPMAGVPVTWTVQSGGGTVTPQSATTGVDGVASARWVLGPRLDVGHVLQASVPGADPVLFTSAVNIPPATTITILGNDTVGLSGQTVPVTVELRLPGGAPLVGAAVSWLSWLYSEPTPLVQPNPAITNAQGRATGLVQLPARPATLLIRANPQALGVVTFRVFGVEAFVRYREVVASGRVCGLTTEGEVFCWGNTVQSDSSHGLPVREPTAYRFARIFHWASHLNQRVQACGITVQGQSVCWRGVPEAQGFNFRDFVLGETACGLTAEGQALCWGTNQFGGVGDGTLTARSTPVAPVGAPAFDSISGDGRTSCGLTATGEVYCWGVGYAGGLGLPQDNPDPTHCIAVPGRTNVSYWTCTAQRVQTDLRFADIDAKCGLTATGEAYCWTEGFRAATRVEGIPLLKQISGDCGLSLDGRVVCWGGGTVATLQTDLRFTRLTHEGSGFGCGMATDGFAYCWRNYSNDDGRMGNPREDGPGPRRVIGQGDS